MRFSALLLWLFLSSIYANGQQLAIGMEGYMGFSRMKSLKELQRIPANYPVPYKSVQNFPAQPGLRLLFTVVPVKRLTVGLLVGYTNTGSRLTYSDYSGQAYRDIIVSGTYLGSYGRYVVFSHGPWSLSARLSLGAIVNQITFKNQVYLNDVNSSPYELVEKSIWRSINGVADLGVEAGYVLSRLYVKGFLSYEIGSTQQAKLRKGSDQYPGSQDYSVQWDGVRVGVGVEYKLKANP